MLEALFKIVEQFEDLRLCRYVEGGCRLVSDEKSGLAGDRHCDHDALPHTAGEPMRIFPNLPVRIGHTDKIEQIGDSVIGSGARDLWCSRITSAI